MGSQAKRAKKVAHSKPQASTGAQGWQRTNYTKSNYGKGEEVVMRYADEFLLTPNLANTPVEFIYTASDVFDTQITIGGHQPRGFDQSIAKYNHFTVISSKINVKFYDVESDTTPILVGVMLGGATGPTISNNGDLMEQPGMHWDYISGNGTAHARASINHAYDLRSFFNQTGDLTQKSQFQGTATGSPSENAFFRILASVHGESSNSERQIACSVSITFVVRFTEAKVLIQS